MLRLGSMLRRSLSSFFHIMPASLRPIHREFCTTDQSPAPAQNLSIASRHPLDRIQTPYSLRCPEDGFLLQRPLSPFNPYSLHPGFTDTWYFMEFVKLPFDPDKSYSLGLNLNVPPVGTLPLSTGTCSLLPSHFSF